MYNCSYPMEERVAGDFPPICAGVFRITEYIHRVGDNNDGPKTGAKRTQT